MDPDIVLGILTLAVSIATLAIAFFIVIRKD